MREVVPPSQVNSVVTLKPALVGGVRAHVEAQVPLAHHRRLIPGAEQLFREEGILEGHASRLGRSDYGILHADLVIVSACHELAASRGALLRRVEGHQLNSFRGQPVDVRRVEGVVVEADILPADVVQNYHKDVGLLLAATHRFRGSRVCRGQGPF